MKTLCLILALVAVVATAQENAHVTGRVPGFASKVKAMPILRANSTDNTTYEACMYGALCRNKTLKCDVPSWTCRPQPAVLHDEKNFSKCMPGALCPKEYKCDVPSWTCRPKPAVLRDDKNASKCMPGALCPAGKKCDVPSWTCVDAPKKDILGLGLRVKDEECWPGALCPEGYKCEVKSWTCKKAQTLEKDTQYEPCLFGALCKDKTLKCDVPSWTCRPAPKAKAF